MLHIGDKCHWNHDPQTKLVYLGNNWSGNGFWHQFAKVDEPSRVWCEITNKELHLIQLEEQLAF